MLDYSSLVGRLACSTAYSLRFDRRFVYYVYVPRNYGTAEQPEAYRLAVLIHGTERAAESYRNKFRGFANRNNAVILAPLFPAGVSSRDELLNFGQLRFNGVNYDTVLLKMIEEAAERFPIRTGKFYLHGFSAGGMFANKFMYVYPERLAAISLGAPGEATYPDVQSPWPLGLRGLDAFLNGERGTGDWNARLKEVPMQIVVGSGDLGERPGGDGAANRFERAALLHERLLAAGMNVRLDCVREAGHDGFAVIREVEDFFCGLALR